MKTIKFAFKEILPLVFSYVFVGIAVGILFSEAGYSPFWVLIASASIYAGSMQIIMISLMQAGTSLFLIAVMTFFINARHIFYGLTFIDEFRKIGTQKHGFWKYPFMALTVTDETYSVLCSMQCPEGVDEDKAKFSILFMCYLLWIVSTTMGALMGEFLPFNTEGVEFSVIAFFTATVVNQWIKFNSHIPAIVGFLSSILFYFVLGPNKFILPALSLSMLVIVIMKDRIVLKNGGDYS